MITCEKLSREKVETYIAPTLRKREDLGRHAVIPPTVQVPRRVVAVVGTPRIVTVASTNRLVGTALKTPQVRSALGVAVAIALAQAEGEGLGGGAVVPDLV